MNILYIINVMILVLINCSYRSSQLYRFLSLELLSYFEQIALISFKVMSFWYPFLEPHLTTYHSNIGVQVR